MRIHLIGFLLLMIPGLHGQAISPGDNFRSPLDIPLVLAGTFGELRSNHFHSGLDIKTQQRQGLPVYGIEEGTVTRIKISVWGYGKVLYVAHPNGLTSVYAHLQKFSPEIDAYIKKKQYEKRTYEIELFPEFGEIKVLKGGLVGYTGNTGGSSGPHLHFEVRNSISEKPINPLLYGMEVRDATNPVLTELYAYPLSEDAQVNRSNEKLEIRFDKQSDGSFLADTVYAAGTIGFGINTYDRQDLAANQNGVYSVTQTVNGTVYSEFDFDTFSFTETRDINALIDYEHLGRFRQRIMKCFRGPGNNLSIYNSLLNDGKVVVREGLSYVVQIEIKDLAGNMVDLKIPVEGKRESLVNQKQVEKTGDYVIAKKPNNYDLGGARIYFPANTFYEDFYIDLKKGTDTVTVHNNTVAVQRNFTITFDASRIPPDQRNQLFIARLDERLRPSHASTFKRGDTFTTRTRSLGTYTLVRDSIAPKIWAKNFKEKQWLNNYHYLSLHLSDDLSGIDTYSATLNGDWILLEYEPKTNTLTYNFDDSILDKKQCLLKVVAMDNVGNTTEMTANFYRK